MPTGIRLRARLRRSRRPRDTAPDLAQFAIDTAQELIDEMSGRFSMFEQLPERDQDAVAAAVVKAVHRGVLAGIALNQRAFNQQIHALREAHPNFPPITGMAADRLPETEPDIWAEKHASAQGPAASSPEITDLDEIRPFDCDDAD